MLTSSTDVLCSSLSILWFISCSLTHSLVDCTFQRCCDYSFSYRSHGGWCLCPLDMSTATPHKNARHICLAPLDAHSESQPPCCEEAQPVSCCVQMLVQLRPHSLPTTSPSAFKSSQPPRSSCTQDDPSTAERTSACFLLGTPGLPPWWKVLETAPGQASWHTQLLSKADAPRGIGVSSAGSTAGRGS